MRPEINNRVCENHALETVRFKAGQTYGEPIQYVCKKKRATEELNEQIDLFNDYLDEANAEARNIELGTYQSAVGTAYKAILREDEWEDEKDIVPFRIFIPSPMNTFVVYSSKNGKPMMSVQELKDVDGNQYYQCYSKDRYFIIQNGKVKDYGINGFDGIPIVEYPNNAERLSDIEICITMFDTINNMQSNRMDPATTKSFIYDNWACQTGKGPDKARKQVKNMLWKFYQKYGIDGYVLQTDIKGYYPNMSHRAVKDIFKEYLDEESHEMVCDILDAQYKGDVGYNPGSQMVQIAGITLLNPVDHYIKETLRGKYYVRYMDDGWHLEHSKEKLEQNLVMIERKLKECGCTLNRKKTKITRLSKGFVFLGFRYMVSDTGKITMKIVSENVRHERRKLRKMVCKSKQGVIPKEKVDECYSSWRNHALKGKRFTVSATAGTPEEISAGIVPTYDRYITRYKNSCCDNDIEYEEGMAVWVDKIPKIDDSGNLVLNEEGVPVTLPDYTLKKIIDTARGSVARYGIKMLSGSE